MTNFDAIEKVGTDAVKQLRIDKLTNGLPFMINSKELPSNECYIEYPDGHISLVTLSNSRRDFREIRSLSKMEAAALRKKYNLAELHA